MYLIERWTWRVRTLTAAQRAENDEVMAESDKATRARLAATAKDGDDDQLPLDEAASRFPTDASSLYDFNDDFIDVRAAFQEEKRGLLTFGVLSLGLGMNGYMFYIMVYNVLITAVFGHENGNSAEPEMYFFGLLTILMWVAVNYFFRKYCWPWITVELFTHRHLVARFNRKTQQVYVNRPEYAGGVVTLPWNAVAPGVNPDDPEYVGIGGVLILIFTSEQTGAGYDEMIMLGRPTRGNAELVGLWEFIRRFMEEGPESVPRPKRLLKLHPFTFEPLHAALRCMSFSWRKGGRLATAIGVAMLSPLVLLLAFCHWVSLLLCHQPRWPKIIEEAGQPGKPIPKLTTAEDFGPEISARLRANCEKDRADRPLPPFRRKSFKTKKAEAG